MAKVKFGAGVADARGHIGNMVFSKNKSGAYIRNKTTPVNPKTSRQLVIRSRLTLISKTWQTLPTGLREAWKNFADQHPVINQFGDATKISGIAMFNRVNGVLLNHAQPIRTTPPPNTDIEELTPFDVTVDGTPIIILDAAPVDPIPANREIEIWLTPPISAGIENANNLFKFVGNFLSGAAVGSDIPIPASLGIGDPNLNVQVIGFYVNLQNGTKSAPIKLKKLTV